MKRTVVNLVFAVLLGLLLSIPCANADTVYLSTANANTIDKFNSSGNGSDFATASSGLNWPLGLAFDGSGNLYVANWADAGNGTIEKFTTSGQASVFANLGPDAPYGDLAFDSHGNLYATVADYTNGLFSGIVEIDRFDSMGNRSVFVSTNIGYQGFGFSGLAFSSSGNLYTGNSPFTIEKFDTNGVGTVFATSGVDNPNGLTFDSSGNLYVANYSNNTIEKFNPNGQGTIFASTNLLSAPIGLAFDSGGNLYVGNHFRGNILEFNPSGIGSVFANGLEGAANYIAIDVPEPSSLLLLGLGLCGLAVFHVSGVAQGGSRHRRR